MRPFLLMILCLSGLSCSKHNATQPLTIIRVEDIPKDFRFPTQIWQSTESQDPILKSKPIVYGPIQVKFTEKSQGLLKEGEAILEFGSGGGDLDLSQLLHRQQGTFYISFDVPGANTALNKKAFFISRSRQRKVDGEIIGSGCRRLLALNSRITSLEFKEQIKLNTTRDRHVSVLSGHFIFLIETETNWIVSQVSFYDSTRPDLICPELNPVDGES